MSENKENEPSKTMLITSSVFAGMMILIAVIVATTILPPAIELRENSQKLYHTAIDLHLDSPDDCGIIEEQMSQWEKDINDFWNFDKTVETENYNKLKEKHELYCT